MSYEQEKLLNVCIEKQLYSNKLFAIELIKSPVVYDEIKDDLEMLTICFDCLFKEVEFDQNYDITKYGMEIEKIMKIINDRIMIIEKSKKSGIIEKLFRKLTKSAKRLKKK